MPETVRIHQGSEAMVAAAVGRLRAEDERMAGDAEAALGSLTWDRGLQAITQHGLQAFLWHELPRRWLTDREASCTSPLRWGVAGAGRAARYAAICRGPQTAAVLQGYEGGGQERSGVELPTCPAAAVGSPGGW